MQGRRTEFFEGWPAGVALPGDYCKVPDGQHPGETGVWYAMAPNGHAGALVPSIHQVVEHEDATITVTPSIVMPAGWHGHLTRGVWT